LLSHRPDRQRAVALGKAPAGRVGQQRVMPVAGCRQAEERLEHAMNMRRGRQILAAGHQRDTLDCVVERHSEVIAGRDVLSCEDDIAKWRRVGLPRTRHVAAFLDPVERAGQGQRSGDIQSQRVIEACALPRRNLAGGEPTAGAGIDRAAISMRRPAGASDLGLDLAACAKARIEHPHRGELGERAAIVLEML